MMKVNVNEADQNALDAVEGPRGHGFEIVRYRDERRADHGDTDRGAEEARPATGGDALCIGGGEATAVALERI